METMAVIIRKGNLNKGYVWEDSCDACGSRLRLYTGNEKYIDPDVISTADFGAYFKKLTYKCPVCGEQQNTYVSNDGHYSSINNDECKQRAIRGKTKREFRILTKEELNALKEVKEAGD
jgi:rRNA maturation protein Nop10